MCSHSQPAVQHHHPADHHMASCRSPSPRRTCRSWSWECTPNLYPLAMDSFKGYYPKPNDGETARPPSRRPPPSLALLLSCRMFTPLTGIAALYVHVPLPPRYSFQFPWSETARRARWTDRRVDVELRPPIALGAVAVAAGWAESGDGDRAAMAMAWC
jgi:hypothetical protein